jgi:hypothetical protein
VEVWSTSQPGLSTPGEETHGSHWRLDGPTASMDVLEKTDSLASSGIQTTDSAVCRLVTKQIRLS